MPCLECGNPDTCRAHIIPKGIGRDIIKASDHRQTLSLAVPDRIDDHIQSGVFDTNILCEDCDRKLGIYDSHAIAMTRLLGTPNEMLTGDTFCLHRPEGVNHEHLALFAAAVVWRAAVSNYRELQQFTIESALQDWFRAVVFRSVSELPAVAILRLASEDTVVQAAASTAMSYPRRFTTGSGHARAKFSTRGLLFLVQLSQAPDPWLQEHAVTRVGAASGRTKLVGPLFSFEAFLESENVREARYIRNVLASGSPNAT